MVSVWAPFLTDSPQPAARSNGGRNLRLGLFSSQSGRRSTSRNLERMALTEAGLLVLMFGQLKACAVPRSQRSRRRPLGPVPIALSSLPEKAPRIGCVGNPEQRPRLAVRKAHLFGPPPLVDNVALPSRTPYRSRALEVILSFRERLLVRQQRSKHEAEAGYRGSHWAQAFVETTVQGVHLTAATSSTRSASPTW
jgi:hypothetical protein